MDDKWKLRFIALSDHVAQWSKQPRKVGAVMVDCERRVAGVGYNGAPAGYPDENVTEENSTFIVIHAEINALQNAVGSGLTMFVNSQPCLPCATAIAASLRVVEVVVPSSGDPGRWSESQREAIKHFTDKNIKVSFHGG